MHQPGARRASAARQPRLGRPASFAAGERARAGDADQQRRLQVGGGVRRVLRLRARSRRRGRREGPAQWEGPARAHNHAAGRAGGARGGGRRRRRRRGRLRNLRGGSAAERRGRLGGGAPRCAAIRSAPIRSDPILSAPHRAAPICNGPRCAAAWSVASGSERKAPSACATVGPALPAYAPLSDAPLLSSCVHYVNHDLSGLRRKA